MQHMCLCHSVDYVSDESSLYTASSDAGGDSDSSYCLASYRPRSQTVISKGPVLGSIVIHPLVLQSVEPHTGTQWPVCNESSGQLALHCGTTLLLLLIGLVL